MAGTEPIDWDDLAFDHGFASPRDLLAGLYLEKGLTQEQVGQVLGMNGGTVGRRLRTEGIPARKNSGIPGRPQPPRLPGSRTSRTAGQTGQKKGR